MPDVPLGSETSTPPQLSGAGEFGCVVRLSDRHGAWIGLRRELDIASAPQLAQSLDDAIASCRLVVVDLHALPFMDSSGLAVILAAQHRARQTGNRLTLVRGPAQVDRLLELTGAAQHLEITDLPATQPAAEGFDGNAPPAR